MVLNDRGVVGLSYEKRAEAEVKQQLPRWVKAFLNAIPKVPSCLLLSSLRPLF